MNAVFVCSPDPRAKTPNRIEATLLYSSTADKECVFNTHLKTGSPLIAYDSTFGRGEVYKLSRVGPDSFLHVIFDTPIEGTDGIRRFRKMPLHANSVTLQSGEKIGKDDVFEALSRSPNSKLAPGDFIVSVVMGTPRILEVIGVENSPIGKVLVTHGHSRGALTCRLPLDGREVEVLGDSAALRKNCGLDPYRFCGEVNDSINSTLMREESPDLEGCLASHLACRGPRMILDANCDFFDGSQKDPAQSQGGDEGIRQTERSLVMTLSASELSLMQNQFKSWLAQKKERPPIPVSENPIGNGAQSPAHKEEPPALHGVQPRVGEDVPATSKGSKGHISSKPKNNKPITIPTTSRPSKSGRPPSKSSSRPSKRGPLEIEPAPSWANQKLQPLDSRVDVVQRVLLSGEIVIGYKQAEDVVDALTRRGIDIEKGTGDLLAALKRGKPFDTFLKELG